MRVETLLEYINCLGMNLNSMIETCETALEDEHNATIDSLKSDLEQMSDLCNEMALKFCSDVEA